MFRVSCLLPRSWVVGRGSWVPVRRIGRLDCTGEFKRSEIIVDYLTVDLWGEFGRVLNIHCTHYRVYSTAQTMARREKRKPSEEGECPRGLDRSVTTSAGAMQYFVYE